MPAPRLEFVRFLLYVTVPLTAFWWSNSPKNTAALRDYVRNFESFGFCWPDRAASQFGYVKKEKGHTLQEITARRGESK